MRHYTRHKERAMIKIDKVPYLQQVFILMRETGNKQGNEQILSMMVLWRKRGIWGVARVGVGIKGRVEFHIGWSEKTQWWDEVWVKTWGKRGIKSYRYWREEFSRQKEEQVQRAWGKHVFGDCLKNSKGCSSDWSRVSDRTGSERGQGSKTHRTPLATIRTSEIILSGIWNHWKVFSQRVT